MGMFSIVHAHGQVIQFKTGGDNLEEYRIGDTVNWWVDKDYVGRDGLLDGVWEGAGKEWTDQFFVIIKDHVLVDVVPIDLTAERSDQWRALTDQYAIQDPPREWWTEAAWAQHDESQELSREHYAREEAAGVHPRVSYTRAKLRQPGFARQIFKCSDEPTELALGESGPSYLYLKTGNTYMHYGRPVVLDRIYDNNNVSVKHPKGSVRLISPSELTAHTGNT